MSNPSLTFKKIERGNVFHRHFNPLTSNKKISFSSAKICAIYAPNGTGKTSLIKVIDGAPGTRFEFEYEDIDYKSNTNIFHVINDQNNRNIIQGTAKDFLLGDNIRKEFELKDFIESELKAVKDNLISSLKTAHSISTASNNLINCIKDDVLAIFIKDLANSQKRGRAYSPSEVLSFISTLNYVELIDYTPEKLAFFQEDMSSKKPIFIQIDKILEKGLKATYNIREVEENSEAIRILNHFKKSQCVVCDTKNINREELLQKKTANKESILDSLDKESGEILDKILKIQSGNDPFNIREIIFTVLSTGDIQNLLELKQEFEAFSLIFENKLKNDFYDIISISELGKKYEEYTTLIDEKPDIEADDLFYIIEVISNNMEKKLEVARDENKNLKISLNDEDFLGLSRDELPLSTGEQNFLSLTFEFLRAKNLENPIVIIDDPISSFDSIYKNKVVYALIKLLEDKQKIVLTHNIDLLRLMSAQYPNSYELYILNNSENGAVGFIHVNRKEREMLINLDSLLSYFREEVFDNIIDTNLFLMSMIPFMRGYTSLIGDSNFYNELTQLMHGYKTQTVDIANIYSQLFGNPKNVIPQNYFIAASDIITVSTDGIQILNKDKFPLLNKTLIHSLIYLKIRLFVEKSLVDKFPSIVISDRSTLGDIISKSFPNVNDMEQMRQRTLLTSKKTLINEFNHFEGNLSIFQPAIDITDTALSREKDAIYQLIECL